MTILVSDSMNQHVRVRFAPSPTGYLHVGGLRTALYNYLFARHHQGTFVLRIEDTDQSRKVEGAVENLVETLRWVGIDYDEGPIKNGPYGSYFQSERLSLYHEQVQGLLKKGHAYRCFCTAGRLEEARKKQLAMKESGAYDRKCRNISPDESDRRAGAGEQHVMRMKVPLEGELEFDDLIRGRVTIPYNVLDDQVLIKSDGFPTYHLAVVVDDFHMGITHVIRGEEWLPSTPKHILLYRFFGWDLPLFAHLPLLLNPDKSKLSKRQGDVAVEDYRQKGYLQEAMVNFAAFLGWNPGDEREIFTMDQLIREFSLERVGKSGAVFNVDKLNWFNQQHLKSKPVDDLVKLVKPLFEQAGTTGLEDAYVRKIIELLKERVTTLPEFVSSSTYFFRDPESLDEKGKQKYLTGEAINHLNVLAERLDSASTFTPESIEQTLRSLSEQLHISAGNLIHPTRLAITGTTSGPGLFELMEALGKETVLRRMKNVRKFAHS